MYNSISWSEFKDFPGEKSYADAHGNYYVYIGNTVCVLNKASIDAADFETNYQADATALL